MKKTLVVALLLCFTVTGCTGTFSLTKKVYNFHRSQPDKWGDELFFLGCVLLPIYGISTFADAIIFNSIEFWTGDNPVTSTSSKKTSKLIKQGDKEALVSFNPQSKQVTIASDGSTVVLEKAGPMILAKNEKGDVLYSTMANDKGEINVYDQNLQMVKTYSPSEVTSMKEKYLK